VIYEEEVVLATVTGSWKDLFSGGNTVEEACKHLLQSAFV